MDSFDRFNETELPSRKDFYSILNDTNISADDYKHAQKVWDAFKIKNLGEYHDLYLKTDVLLLADVFEDFRETCLNYYKLDPCHYMTSPGLSWDASMRCSLPTGDFEWIDPDDIELFNYHEESEKGLILEVDLEYPEELHDLHNDYPCAPEKICITNDMLSEYCSKIKKRHKISSGTVPQLITSLRDKEKYVLHYQNLKLYLELGLKVKKIHRALEITQNKWLKQYIDFNTEKRENAKNGFEKDFFKLMNNSVFGKTMKVSERELKLN